jgi:hypothetical protein
MTLVLVPDSYNNDATAQLQAVTRIMYCAAAFLVVWVAQTTETYRFAAMLLQQEQREQALKLAPTISLTIGVFSSLLLAGTYLASCLWLQTSYDQRPQGDAIGNRAAREAGASPRQVLQKHWVKITGMLLPMFPGVIGSVMNVVTEGP